MEEPRASVIRYDSYSDIVRNITGADGISANRILEIVGRAVSTADYGEGVLISNQV